MQSAVQVHAQVTGCLLAGGLGRRMGGQDKGLVPYKGKPLGEWCAHELVRQTGQQFVIANRHADNYISMMRRLDARPPAGIPLALPDSADLPPYSGPLAGILTALSAAHTPWLMVMPCDTPHVPTDVVSQLMAEAECSKADAVVPRTLDADGRERFHWATVLLRQQTVHQLHQIFGQEERKLRVFIQSLNWSWVSFSDAGCFRNVNSLEMLNGGD